jgi:hypothetical protein
MCTVDLNILLSTIGGAAIALVGTMLADFLRGRGDRQRDNRSERRQGYLDFLLALNAGHERLRDVARTGGNGDLRTATARAVTEAKVYEGREKLLMSADRAVATAGERAFQGLLRVRDAIRDGAELKSAPYHAAYHAFAEKLWRLREVIRTDLGVPELSAADLDRPGWDGAVTCETCRARAAEAAGHPVPAQYTGAS